MGLFYPTGQTKIKTEILNEIAALVGTALHQNGTLINIVSWSTISQKKQKACLHDVVGIRHCGRR